MSGTNGWLRAASLALAISAFCAGYWIRGGNEKNDVVEGAEDDGGESAALQWCREELYLCQSNICLEYVQ